MDEPITVREATLSDIPSMMHLRREGSRHYLTFQTLEQWETWLQTTGSEERYATKIHDPLVTMWIAETTDGPISHAGVKIEEDIALVCSSFGVPFPGAQAALYGVLETYAREQQCSELRTEVFVEDYAALEFYMRKRWTAHGSGMGVCVPVPVLDLRFSLS